MAIRECANFTWTTLHVIHDARCHIRNQSSGGLDLSLCVFTSREQRAEQKPNDRHEREQMSEYAERHHTAVNVTGPAGWEGSFWTGIPSEVRGLLPTRWPPACLQPDGQGCAAPPPKLARRGPRGLKGLSSRRSITSRHSGVLMNTSLFRHKSSLNDGLQPKSAIHKRYRSRRASPAGYLRSSVSIRSQSSDCAVSPFRFRLIRSCICAPMKAGLAIERCPGFVGC